MLFMMISILKLKLKTFSEVIKTLFDGGEIPRERIEYSCIPCISIDSVLKIDKSYYGQVYLEQCKYRVKKREIKSLIDYEIELDSDYESDQHWCFVENDFKKLIQEYLEQSFLSLSKEFKFFTVT